jgi:hypothetical protein
MAAMLRRLSGYAFGRARSGSEAWFRVGVVVTALRIVHSLTRRRADVVQLRLRSGERIEVRDIGRRRR